MGSSFFLARARYSYRPSLISAMVAKRIEGPSIDSQKYREIVVGTPASPEARSARERELSGERRRGRLLTGHLRDRVRPAIRIAHDLVVHRASLGHEAGVHDVAGDLRLREPEVRAGG